VLFPNSPHSEILCRGAAAWNAWREKNPSIVPDLNGAALALSDDPRDQESFNLMGGRLQNCVLRFAKLSTANLEAADMPGVDLTHARLHLAILSAANLSNSCLDYAFLCGAVLKKACLRGASLRFATLSTANLQAADMSDADLMHARLDQADLSGANLSNARLDYADFAGAKLSAVDLSGASLQHAKNLTESQVRESVGDLTTILPMYLQGSVPWSPATIKRRDFGSLPTAAKAHGPINSYNASRWGVAAFLGSVVLVLAVLVALLAIRASLLDAPSGKKGTEQFLARTSSNLEEGDKGLRERASEAPIEKKATSEERISPNPTTGTDSVNHGAPKLAPEIDRATASLGTSPAIRDRWATTLRPSQPTPGDLNGETKASEPPQLVWTATPPSAWPHAIVPEVPSSEPSTLVRAGSGQTIYSSGAEPPPTPPVRNPARGDPLRPVRNPLR
jgi:hypothetical protein